MKNQAESPHELLWEKIKDSKIAMLTSICRDVELHSRPMMTAQDAFDGTLFFFSRLNTEKIDEVTHNPQVLLTYAEPKEMAFVSVKGSANISRNPAKIREHWLPALEAYFDKGMNDPELCLIEVEVTEAEYWDTDKSHMAQILERVHSSVTGRPPTLGARTTLRM
jgi:general stress protein 26